MLLEKENHVLPGAQSLPPGNINIKVKGRMNGIYQQKCHHTYYIQGRDSDGYSLTSGLRYLQQDMSTFKPVHICKLRPWEGIFIEIQTYLFLLFAHKTDLYPTKKKAEGRKEQCYFPWLLFASSQISPSSLHSVTCFILAVDSWK